MSIRMCAALAFLWTEDVSGSFVEVHSRVPHNEQVYQLFGLFCRQVDWKRRNPGWSLELSKGVTPTLFNDGIAGSLAIGNYLYYNGGYRTICVLKISSDLYTAPVRSIWRGDFGILIREMMGISYLLSKTKISQRRIIITRLFVGTDRTDSDCH